MNHLTQDQISTHVDAELSPADERNVVAHLAVCANCRAQVRQLLAMRNLIQDLPVKELDPWFADRMEALVTGEERVDLQWLGPERTAAHAVVGLALIVAGLMLGLLLQSETPSTVSERNLMMGPTDTTTQLLMSYSELSKDDLLLVTMTGD